MIEPNDPFERKMPYDAHYDGNLNRCHRLVRQELAGDGGHEQAVAVLAEYRRRLAALRDRHYWKEKCHALRT
jgi:hypothetical protein